MPSASALLTPWAKQDIGAVGIPGGASYNSSTFTLLASGSTNVGTTADQFHFVYQPTAGNCEILARVTSLTNSDALAEAGLMIRKSLDASSAYAFVADTPSSSNGVRLEYRATAGGATALAASSTGSSRVPPEWLRLVLSGSTVTAYRSNNTSQPTSWSSFGSVNISALSGGFFIGLAVTSHNNPATATATFTNVSLTLGTPAAPIGLTATAGAGQAALGWTASSGATSYTVKRATVSGGPYTTIASGLTSTSYTDPWLPIGIYYYVVSASNATGEGGNSNKVIWVCT